MGRDIVDAWTPRIRCRPVPRPSLIDFSADGLGSDRRDWTTVHALERREKINHVDLTVRIGSGNLQCNPNGSDVYPGSICQSYKRSHNKLESLTVSQESPRESRYCSSARGRRNSRRRAAVLRPSVVSLAIVVNRST